MSNPYRIETLMRPVFEAKAAVMWSVATLWLLLLGLVTSMGWATILALLAVTGAMAAWRAYQTQRLVRQQVALMGRPVDLLAIDALIAALPHLGSNLWLGWGWRWEPSHTARAAEVARRDLEQIYPPRWLMTLLRVQRDPANERGLQWVHGLEPNESDVLVPFDALKGHCAIIATTGAIKTRLAALIIPQIVMRGDVVVVVDPKGDHDLREICRLSAQRTGVPDKFQMLHPAFASQSVRMDLLKNWDRVSQVASRVSLVLSAQEDSTFKEFCWMAVHRLTNGLKYVGQRVNLYTLKTAMESRAAVERLANEALRQFFTRDASVLRPRIEQELNRANAQRPTGRRSPNAGVETSIPELSAMISVWQTDVPETAAEAASAGLPVKPDEVRGLVAILEANKEWFGKMIVSITPMLAKLTTDDLRGLLSPDYLDMFDERPIMDMKRIVEGRHVFYLGTDALADPSVGKALVAMVLAELASVAAEIYNHGRDADPGDEPRRIHVLIDEWGDAMCEPLVQQANKGRGAGVFLWAMGQTIADLEVAFGGDRASARRFLGNMNNLIVGAIQDPETIEMMVEKFGTTTVTTIERGQGAGSKTEDTGMEFSAQTSAKLKNTDVDLIPATVMSQMPDLQYVAILNRAMKVKGRIPVVQLQS